MPNFLSAALGVGNSIRTSGTSGLFNPGGFQGAVTAAAATTLSTGNPTAGVGAALAPLGLGALGLAGVLGGRGTKPMALHTEYAEEDANWSKPYGMGTDIVFYLQRADQTSTISDTTNNFGGDLSKGDQGNFNGQANSLTTNALPTNVGGVEPSRIPSNVQAGPNSTLPKAQSPLSQIATATTLGALAAGPQRFASNNTFTKTSLGATPTAIGFLSNFDKSASTQGDAITNGSSVVRNSLADNIEDSLSSAASSTNRFTPNYPTGAKYWSNVTNNAFNPGGTSPFEVPTSELSAELSQATGGVNSSEFYRDLSTQGKVNFTSPDAQGSTALDFGDAIQGGLEVGPVGTLNGGAGDDIPAEWYFITPPQQVSWSKSSNSKSQETYGSNGSYLSYGSTKLRKLTLSDTLVEGFSDGKAVEDNILQLEKCMKMVINEGSGYTSPYCWHAYAGGKSYGVFIITSVEVREVMRDMSGHATRAVVDIELQEVPSYQVSSGTDLTAKALTGVTSEAFNANKDKAIQNAVSQDQKAAKASGKSTTNSGSSNGNGSGESSSTGANNRTKATDPRERITFASGGGF